MCSNRGVVGKNRQSKVIEHMIVSAAILRYKELNVSNPIHWSSTASNTALKATPPAVNRSFRLRGIPSRADASTAANDTMSGINIFNTSRRNWNISTRNRSSGPETTSVWGTEANAEKAARLMTRYIRVRDLFFDGLAIPEYSIGEMLLQFC